MANEKKPASPCYCKPVHLYYTITGAHTNVALNVADANKPASPTAATAPGANLEYRIERLNVSPATAITLSITDGTRAVWGPHVLPAGFAGISFGENSDKSRTGMRLGANIVPSFTTTAGGTGELEAFGYIVPVT